jgi:UDP-N-acetylglucosamine diphosphorylase / glucose-1-phosphate thymidylyltransferase / UDP-N-acetylgalactosamine diphosphorylase / glucosamine-1-phosphate N-acetyltransferase / galactosamine-1-phosphate N-acetyltransferase
MNQDSFNWTSYIQLTDEFLPHGTEDFPWHLAGKAPEFVARLFASLSSDFKIVDAIAIHKSAVIETNVTLKAPVIIGPGCFIASHCYLRGGVYLMGHNSIGPGCEIKASFIFPHSNLAHFNFIGDSILGSDVNFEAGSIIANHFNERKEKKISVLIQGKRVETHTEKFGALIGDGSKIGANAVLSPGTILNPNSVVKRLELVNQLS